MIFRTLFAVTLLALAPAAAADEQESRAEHFEQRVEAPAVPAPRPSVLVGEVKTERFRIVHTGAAKGAAEALSKDIEAVRQQFVQTLGRDWPGVTEIRMGVGREEYEAIALPGGKPPKWSVALAYPTHNIVLLDALSLNAPGGSQTLRHELSHVALGRIAKAWPHWFQEGLAMRLTGERHTVAQYTALFRAVTQDRVFHFADLSDGWPDQPREVELAYAQSLSFTERILEQHGSAKLGELMDAIAGGEAFELAFSRVMKTSLITEENAWRETLPRRYSWWPVVATSTTVLSVGAGLLTLGFLLRRRQYKKRIDAMAVQEAAEDEARRLAEEQAQAEAEDAFFDSGLAPEVSDPEAFDKKPTIH